MGRRPLQYPSTGEDKRRASPRPDLIENVVESKSHRARDRYVITIFTFFLYIYISSFVVRYYKIIIRFPYKKKVIKD